MVIHRTAAARNFGGSRRQRHQIEEIARIQRQFQKCPVRDGRTESRRIGLQQRSGCPHLKSLGYRANLHGEIGASLEIHVYDEVGELGGFEGINRCHCVRTKRDSIEAEVP